MKTHRPTTPSRRSLTGVDYRPLSNVKPKKSLLLRKRARAGRNSRGRITVRHQGGGHKKLYRIIDFRQNKLGQSARIETLEYDPYRSAFIALVVYADGGRRYIIAPDGVRVSGKVITADAAPLSPGNRMKLKNIPVGTQVHNIELAPNAGGQLARSAGSYAEVLALADRYVDLRLSSGEVRKVLGECFASVGRVSNPERNLVVGGKAGRSRWMGIRPTVRGSVMNPRDHKYGGGEGRTQRGTRRPKDIWGNITGGRKTRKRRKWSNKLIVKRRT